MKNVLNAALVAMALVLAPLAAAGEDCCKKTCTAEEKATCVKAAHCSPKDKEACAKAKAGEAKGEKPAAERPAPAKS